MPSTAPGVREGYHTVRPYLVVDDAERILDFMKEVFRRTLEVGAPSVRDVSTQEYGDRSGGMEGPAGNRWWISRRMGQGGGG